MKLFTAITLSLAYLTLADTITETEEHQSIDDLISQLRSKEYKAREIASYQLWQRGEASLAQLKTTVDSDDPEQMRRAEILIRNIEAGVLPSTDKKVIAAIDRYRGTTSMTEKLLALEELAEMKAFKQVLYLIHWEEDDEIRQQLGRNRKMLAVPIYAAKQALSAGETEEAILLLRIAPDVETNRRALAHVLKHTGKLDAEIEATKKLLPEASAEARLLTQLRTNGDLTAAKKLAQRANKQNALATLAILDGDPTALVDYRGVSSSSPSHRIALSLLKRLYLKSDPTYIDQVLEELKDGVDGDASEAGELEYITRISLLMGNRELGEKLLKRHNKTYAQAYFATQEYSEEEFKLLGTPNPVTQADEFATWLEEEIVLELDVDLGHLSEQASKIEGLVHFYFDRGEMEQSMRILKPLLNALLEDGDDRWFHIVAELPIYGMSEFVGPLAIERGNEDNTYIQLSREIFGNVEEMDLLWNLVQELTPNSSEEEHFQSVLEIMGVQRASASGKGSGLSLVVKHLEGLTGKARTELLISLAYAAEGRNDFGSMLKHYKELCKDADLAEKRGFHHKYQRSAELIFDWKEIVASYDLKPESYINKPVQLARYAIAKRKLGEKKLGDSLLRKAILQTLGMTEELNLLAQVLHECGEIDEAKAIWLDHFACQNVEDKGFYYTLYNINHQSRFATAEGNWGLASSFALAEMTILAEPNMLGSRYYTYLRSGYSFTFTAGMTRLEKGDKSGAVAMLEYAHHILPGDGTLADDFFPRLMTTQLKGNAEKWFRQSWSHLQREIAAYPLDHNARNTAAWLGSRAGKNLDDSMKHAKFALHAQPEQPAYLDTLAEVYFAKHNRSSAVKYSDEALSCIESGAYAYTRVAESSSTMYSELTRQNARFKKEPFPKR